MRACPKCGGYNIGFSIPIKLNGEMPNTAKGMLKAWAAAHGPNGTELLGTARIMCRACGYLGPSMDVTGRKAEDVRRDPVVAAEVKKLWNEQPDFISPS